MWLYPFKISDSRLNMNELVWIVKHSNLQQQECDLKHWCSMLVQRSVVRALYSLLWQTDCKHSPTSSIMAERTLPREKPWERFSNWHLSMCSRSQTAKAKYEKAKLAVCIRLGYFKLKEKVKADTQETFKWRLFYLYYLWLQYLTTAVVKAGHFWTAMI